MPDTTPAQAWASNAGELLKLVCEVTLEAKGNPDRIKALAVVYNKLWSEAPIGAENRVVFWTLLNLVNSLGGALDGKART